MTDTDAIRASLDAYPEARLDPATARALLDALDTAEARAEAVRDVHRPVYESLTGQPICDACDHPTPCPTIRALDAG